MFTGSLIVIVALLLVMLLPALFATQVVFRSQYTSYRAGSAGSGEPQYIPGPGGSMVLNPKFRDEPLVTFNDHLFSTDDAELVAKIKQLPGFSSEAGVKDFWVDERATAHANGQPYAQVEPPPAAPDSPPSTAVPDSAGVQTAPPVAAATDSDGDGVEDRDDDEPPQNRKSSKSKR